MREPSSKRHRVGGAVAGAPTQWESRFIRGVAHLIVRISFILGSIPVLAAAGVCLVSAAAGTTASGSNVGWGGFANTPDELRHSPLTLIDKRNVSRLGRVATVDFHAIDAGVRRGQQSYPVVAGRSMYVTPNDEKVTKTLDKVGRTILPAVSFRIGWMI